MIGHARGHNSVRVGIFGIAGIAAFGSLFFYSTNRTLGADRSTVYVRLAAADGLQRGDAIVLRGVKVGEVRALEFERGDVIVRARLVRAVPLTKSAVADMVPADMFGRQTIVLREGVGGGVALSDGDTLAGTGPVTLAARIEAIGRRADALLSDSMIAGIRGLLAGAGDATTGAALAADQIRQLARDADQLLVDQRTTLDELTREAAAIARNLRAATDPEELSALRDRFEHTSANLASATASMDTSAASLARLLAGLEQGRGTAGRLLQDDALYERTVGTLTALERLIDDVRANPKRYVTIKVF